MGKPETFRLVLVRTGTTEWDLAGRLTGQADLPLAEEQREPLATAIEAWLREAQDAGLQAPKAVLTGPDEASQETAELAASVLSCKTRAVNDLSEQSLGLWEGLLESELVDRCRTSFRSMREEPASVVPPGGESWGAFEARVVGAIARSVSRLKSSNATVVVVLRERAFAAVEGVLDSLESAVSSDSAVQGDAEPVNGASPGAVWVVPTEHFVEVASARRPIAS